MNTEQMQSAWRQRKLIPMFKGKRDIQEGKDLIRANDKHSKRCMTARSAILVHCANGTLHTAEL